MDKYGKDRMQKGGFESVICQMLQSKCVILCKILKTFQIITLSRYDFIMIMHKRRSGAWLEAVAHTGHWASCWISANHRSI